MRNMTLSDVSPPQHQTSGPAPKGFNVVKGRAFGWPLAQLLKALPKDYIAMLAQVQARHGDLVHWQTCGGVLNFAFVSDAMVNRELFVRHADALRKPSSQISLFLVGAMHSVLGGATLIRPLLAQSDFPVVLGSQRNGRLTLWFGWHALTLFWWAQAIVFWRMSKTGVDVGRTTLIVWAVACGLDDLL